jgi:hypothetical protein
VFHLLIIAVRLSPLGGDAGGEDITACIPVVSIPSRERRIG